MRLFVIILISIALLSCSNGNRVSNNGTFMTLHIDTTQCRDVCWSDIVKEYDWIVLENNDNCFVDDPCKTLFFDDNLYVVDGTRNNAILVFDGSGKFVNRIGRKGNGHGEYVNIVDATINEDDKQIAILSFPNTVYIYELDGTFVSKHIFPEDVYYSIAYYCKGYILSNSNATYIQGGKAKMFTYYDNSFTELDRFFDNSKIQVSIQYTGSSSFMNTKSSLLYFDWAANRMLSWNDGIQNYSIIDLQYDNPMPIEMYSDIMDFNAQIVNYNFLVSSFVSDSVIFCQYITEGIVNNMMGDFVHGFNKRVDNMYYKTYYNSDNGWFYTPITADLYDEEMKQKFPIYGSQVVDWEGNLMFFKWKVRK